MRPEFENALLEAVKEIVDTVYVPPFPPRPGVVNEDYDAVERQAEAVKQWIIREVFRD